MSRKLTRSSVGLALGLAGGVALHIVGLGETSVAAWFIACGLSSLGANLAHGIEDAERVKKG